MPIITATFALTAAAAAFRSGSRRALAISPEAEFANGQVTQMWDRFEETISFEHPHAYLLSEIEDLAAEHSTKGWDGNVAPPVSYQTVENARAFAEALPDFAGRPELAVDPDDASISFEWHGGYRKVFSVSIGRSGRLACAGINGSDDWHAALAFDGSLPSLVAESIRLVSK